MTLAELEDPGRCPDCGGELRSMVTDQPAMFRQGGYGATERVRRVDCHGCSYTLVTEIAEVRPDGRVVPVGDES